MRKELGRKGRRQTQLSWTDSRKRIGPTTRREKEKKPYNIRYTYKYSHAKDRLYIIMITNCDKCTIRRYNSYCIVSCI